MATYLNFLLRITDIITSRLPKTAANIIDIIVDALNTKNKTSNQSCCLTWLGDAVLGDVVTSVGAKFNRVVVLMVDIASDDVG